VRYYHRIRAVAAVGNACRLGAGPAPGLRGSAPRARCATYAQIPPGCAPRLQWDTTAAWSSTAVTTGFVRGHRAPDGGSKYNAFGMQNQVRAPAGQRHYLYRWPQFKQHLFAAELATPKGPRPSPTCEAAPLSPLLLPSPSPGAGPGTARFAWAPPGKAGFSPPALRGAGGMGSPARPYVSSC
jgi:hypothetical protein